MVRYEIKEGLQYAHGGEMQDASFIEMRAPNYKDMTNFSVVKQEFIKAITNVSEGSEASESSGDSGTISGDDAISLLYATGADMGKVIAGTQELLRASAMVDGEAKLTIPLLEKLSIADAEGLIGCYIANFIAAPLLDGQ